MATRTRPDLVSVDQYLDIEETMSVRHELVGGLLYAMSGGTARHNLIVGNIEFALRTAARGGPCLVFSENVKLRTPNDDVYYPDVMVVCHDVEDETVVLGDPCLLVEVASPSSARTDRSEKLPAFKTIPSLRACLIVEQRMRLVDHYWRDDGGAWQHASVTDKSGGQIRLSCPELVLTLDEVYERLRLDPPRAPLYVSEEAWAAFTR